MLRKAWTALTQPKGEQPVAQPPANFAELKQKLSIEQVATWLGLDFKKQGEQLRGPCPLHGGDDRTMVITPSKQVFYCFANECRKGGDLIELVVKVKKISPKDAGIALQNQFFGTAPKPAQTKAVEQRVGPMQPLDYLESQHELIAAHGLDETTCRYFGAGFASKGIMRGTIAIPVHDRKGVLVGYLGLMKGEATRFARSYEPGTILFNAHRIQHDQPLFITDDPLKCLVAHQMGMQAVAFLTGISPPLLTALAILMEERGVTTAQLF